MSQSKLILAVILAVILPGPKLRHVGVSATDLFLECASQALQKRVFTTVWLAPGSNLKCSTGANRGELLKALTDSNLVLKENEDTALLMPKRMMADQGGISEAKWARFDVNTKVVQFSPMPAGSKLVTDAKKEEISSAILKAVRSVPLAPANDPDDSVGTVQIPVLLQLDEHELMRSVTSVIAIWGQPRGEKRIVYGEIEKGRYVALWDSPLVEGGDFGLGYEDVDRDGNLEILVTARAYKDGEQISIFTTEGVEITRQSCPDDEFSGGDNAGTACPIVGRKITLDRKTQNPTEIRAVSYKRNDWTHPDRYVLKNRRYILLKGNTTH